MSIDWKRLQPHGRRAALATAAAIVTVLGVAFVAHAQLGADATTPSASTTAADTSTPTTSAAGGNGDNNVAVAVNGQDDKTVYAVRLKVILTGRSTVDATNAAVAAASCTDCTTVALALEGVVVWGSPDTVVPVNLALALNSDCTNCQTLAAAYQYVTSVDGKVRITGAGRRTIASLRQQLNGLRTSGLDIFAVKAEADRIAGEFYQVLQNDVVPIGKPTGTFPPAGATPSPFAQGTPGDVPGTADTVPPDAGPVSSSSPTDATPTAGPTDAATPTPSPTFTTPPPSP
jgi:putative peptide zinc metalloprotease protein